jgi:RND family efflux transporter MFP subunit
MNAGKERQTAIRVRATSIWVVASALFIILPGCGGKPKPPPPPPPKVTVAPPVQRMVTDTVELTGNTQAIYTVQLVARVAGYLEKVSFQDGQMVEKGQPLFLIQQNTYEDTLRQAEATLSQYQAQFQYAAAQFTRYSNLVERKAASQSDVDNWRYQRDTAQANLRSAEAQRDLAQLNLGYTDIRAPFRGRIDRRLTDPGNLVGSGTNTVLAEVSQIDPLYVYFNISDTDLGRLLRGTHWTPGRASSAEWPVFAGLPNEEGYPHQGHLDYAAITLTTTTGTLLLRGVFANPEGAILPGLYARVRVPLETRPALLVPEVALGNDQQGPYILLVNEKNTVERRNVKTGPVVDNNLRVIEQGLTGQESVIVKGLQKAAPGRPVTPEREGSASAPAPGSPPSPPQPKAEP